MEKLEVGLRSQAALFADDAEPVAGLLWPVTTPQGDPEQAYAAAVSTVHRKRFAQFFTPQPLARLMVEMATPRVGERVLDPAVGTGVFVQAVAEAQVSAHITALDVDPVVLSAFRACTQRAMCAETIQADFLAWNDTRRFDVVIGNPPYLKYQHFECSEELRDRLRGALGITVSRLSNLYLLFILEGYRRLVPGGRLVFVVPGEWTNANFGVPFKRFLLAEGCLRRMVYFSHVSEHFDDALTTVSVLELRKPAENEACTTHFDVCYVKDGTSADAVRRSLATQTGSSGVHWFGLDLASVAGESKWDDLLRRRGVGEDIGPGAVPLSAFCTSRRGIATGANGFFHLSRAQAAAHGLASHNLRPCIGGARHLQGLVLDQTDLERMQNADLPTVLFDVTMPPNADEARYIRDGEAQGLPSRYLLSKRKPWYSMEGHRAAPVWVGVFARGGLRAIRNRAGVATLTTFHGLYPADERALVADALTVLLNADITQREVARRRRVYGAGLEKMEPADLLDLRLPDLAAASDAQLTSVARYLAPMDEQVRRDGTIDAMLMTEVDRAISALMHALSARATEQNAIDSVAV